MGNPENTESLPLPPFPKERIGGFPIAALSRDETARYIVDAALAARGRSTRPALFSSANGQVLSLAARKSDPRTAQLYSLVDMISADGQSLVFASRMFGKGAIPERCATTDLFHDVAKIAVDEDISFYVLGANADENAMAVRNMKKLYPGLRVVGSHHGYLSTPEDEKAVVEDINRAAPDVLWVAMGVPRQLEFCVRWQDQMTGVGVIKTCGGLLNFLSETRSRAPEWMQRAGLEWSYRLALEPRRLLVRYFTTNLHAAWLLASRTN